MITNDQEQSHLFLATHFSSRLLVLWTCALTHDGLDLFDSHKIKSHKQRAADPRGPRTLFRETR